jgi:hypothetical protein
VLGAVYTPAQLVDTIVDATVGAFLRRGVTPRIVDPACGDGAFLVGAYRVLLDRFRPPTAAERARILVEHIHGVDLDPTAVAAARARLLDLAGGDVDLSANLRCGNAILDEEFDWRAAFPAVFAGGGFDVVLGNPPYVDAEQMTRRVPGWRAACARRYRAASGNWDLYCVFIERAFQLLRPDGLNAFIVPNKLLSADYAAGARAVLAEENTLLALRDCSTEKHFPAAVYPIIYVAARRKPERQVDAARPWRMAADPLAERLRRFAPLGAFADVRGAATVSEAYALAPLIAEDTGGAGARFVNSGLIDRFVSRWGERPCRYLGASLARPHVPADAMARLSAARQQQARAPKLIVAGMTRVLECVADLEGAWLAGKSTTIVLDARLDLRYLAGLVNSRLATHFFTGEFGGNRLAGGFFRIGPRQIKMIPIVEAPAPLHDEIVATGDALTAALQHGEAADALNEHLERLVEEAYGVTAEELEAVKAREIPSLCPPEG